VDFGGGPLTNAGGNDVFVAKLDGAGNHLWSRRFGDSLNQVGADVKVDASGDIYVTGWFEGTVDFGGGALTSAGGYDVFIAKFDEDGNHVWSQRFGDASEQYGNNRVAVDASGNIIVMGRFGGNVNFGGRTLTSLGSYDIFVAKFNGGGSHVWSQRFGNESELYIWNEWSIAADASDNVVMAGAFEGNMDCGGGALQSAGSHDVFVATFGPEPTGIADIVVPKMFALHQNVPNPFNPTTVIQYDVPEEGGEVTLLIYDVAGRLVRTLVDHQQTAGRKRVTWNGDDDRGSRVASGVYFYRMRAPGFDVTKKMVLIQ
jgi:hypothetical protein